MYYRHCFVDYNSTVSNFVLFSKQSHDSGIFSGWEAESCSVSLGSQIAVVSMCGILAVIFLNKYYYLFSFFSMEPWRNMHIGGGFFICTPASPPPSSSSSSSFPPSLVLLGTVSNTCTFANPLSALLVPKTLNYPCYQLFCFPGKFCVSEKGLFWLWLKY